ncbi:MAG: hypothetical protein ACOX5R_21175 [bacterium]|jgi:hypothetical protein
MNARTQKIDEDYSTSQPSRISQIILALCLVPFLLPILFAPPLGCFLLVLAGVFLTLESRTRVHGLILLSSITYTIIAVVLAMNKFFWLLAYAKVLQGITFYLLYYIPPFVPVVPVVLLYYWSFILTPLFLAESVYWLWRSKSAVLMAGGIGIIILISISGTTYAFRCERNYKAVQVFVGQTLPAEELYEQAGHPIYEAYNDGPWDLRPHWVYSDGDSVIPMTVDAHGLATVHDRNYFFFD